MNLPDPALFEGLPDSITARWVSYFYHTPRTPDKPRSLRPRIFALYDPFAKRSVFPAGIRYCINVYTGCAHHCRYCYTRNYILRMEEARPKSKLLAQAERDLKAMEALALPPVPVHLSNSTDPYQEALERQMGHTRQLMRLMAEHRERFSTVVFLTKNPSLAAEPAYIELLRALMPCVVEVSLTFFHDAARQHYEPFAPCVASRMEGIVNLREAGIPVSLRIDPLFPREPLPTPPWQKSRLQDYAIESAHSLEDIEQLVRFGSQQGCEKVIVSPLKLPVGRRSGSPLKERFRPLYAEAWGGKPQVRGFSMRLPQEYVHERLIAPVRDICQAEGIPLQHCKQNLISTK